MELKNHLLYYHTFSIKCLQHNIRLFGTGYWIEQALFWEGLSGYESETIKCWLNESVGKHWVMDIGANTGLFALAAAVTNKNAVVIAFEPHPIFVPVLAKNIALKQVNINVEEKLVAEMEGEQIFYYSNPGEGNPYSSTMSLDHFVAHQASIPNMAVLPATTLDSVAHKYKLTSNGLIKIDAEGFTFSILKGGLTFLQEYTPVIIAEIQSEKEAMEVAGLLGPIGYTYYSISDDGLHRLSIPYDTNCLNYKLTVAI